MPAAFKHWKEIEEKSGKKLFTPAGIMNIRKDYVMITTYQVVFGIGTGQISDMRPNFADNDGQNFKNKSMVTLRKVHLKTIQCQLFPTFYLA